MYILQDLTSRWRRIFDDPLEGWVQGTHWRLQKILKNCSIFEEVKQYWYNDITDQEVIRYVVILEIPGESKNKQTNKPGESKTNQPTNQPTNQTNKHPNKQTNQNKKKQEQTKNKNKNKKQNKKKTAIIGWELYFKNKKKSWTNNVNF